MIFFSRQFVVFRRSILVQELKKISNNIFNSADVSNTCCHFWQGPVLAVLHAVEAFLTSGQQLPVNLKVCLDVLNCQVQ